MIAFLKPPFMKLVRQRKECSCIVRHFGISRRLHTHFYFVIVQLDLI